MEVFNNFLTGTITLFSDPVGILIFFGGVIGGMLFGAIPGVSMLTLAAILLPFTAHLSPEHGIMLFSVIYCTGVYGGAITAILFNIPGAPENAPTAFDGYPMTQKGQAGKAVGAAVMCSAIGGVVSCIIMMIATAPIADWAISAFGPPEIFALVFFGLAVASSVGAKTFWKGWLSILIGLMVAVVGLDPVGGIERYDFEMPYMLAGIHFIPTILGFFAVSEIFVQAEKKAIGSYKAPKMGVEFPTLKELLAHKVAVVRSIIIGFFCGILPGIGATLAAFMGYNEAVRWSKTPEEFGKGKLEGVISSETANNAATGAAMIPLLALGLPGGALTAMMVGVFQMHDMEPGPLVFMNSADLVWVVFAAMFFANLSIIFVGYLETKTIINLLAHPVPVPGTDDPATGNRGRLRGARLDHRRGRHVPRRHHRLLPATFGLLGGRHRARSDPRQDRRTNFRPGDADAAFRVEWLFRSADCSGPVTGGFLHPRRQHLRFIFQEAQIAFGRPGYLIA